EPDHVASFKDVAGIDARETILVHAQNFLIARVLNAVGKPKIAFQIENPLRDTIEVLADQRAFASGDLKLVKIVPGFIAIVEADVKDIWIRLWRAEQHDAHAF